MADKRGEISSKLVRSDLLRWLLIVCGWLAIAGGIMGTFLPLMPTVPLLLPAAACFARSSERFHTWLVELDHLGPLIRDYLKNGAIPVRAKRMAIGMIWISFPASAFLFVQALWLRVLLIAIAAGVTPYLPKLPDITGAGG